jgi:hypothetical protein
LKAGGERVGGVRRGGHSEGLEKSQAQSQRVGFHRYDNRLQTEWRVSSITILGDADALAGISRQSYRTAIAKNAIALTAVLQ